MIYEDGGHLYFLHLLSRNQGSSANTVARLRAGPVGFDSRQRQRFLFATASKPVPGPTQSPIQWVQGDVSPAVKQPGREAYHSPLFRAEVKNTWSYTSTPPIPVHGVVSNQ
jgi:hypothetical protein